ERGGRLRDILIKEGFITEEKLMLALSQGLSIPHIRLTKIKIDPEVTKIIPKEMAQGYQIFPVSRFSRTITLAMADPLNVFTLDDIKAFTGFEIRPVIATSLEIQKAIDRSYGESAQTVLEDMVKDAVSDVTIKIEEQKLDIEDTSYVEEAPLVKLVDLLLKESVRMNASDVLIEPFENQLRVRYRIDGTLKEIPSPPHSLRHSIVTRLKVMSELNISERRLPQDGRFKVRMKDKEVDFRISILPSMFGEKVVLRVLNKSEASLDLANLGFEPENLKKIKEQSLKPHGMILVCGPTGSGKTTTLYSVLKYVDDPKKNIVTVEDPVEYQLEGINQVTVRPEIGLGFADALRSILRQDPDVIMIGEIRDFETVNIAIKSALTGHLVLSTLHTTTACGAVVRLINMGVEPFLITASVVIVVAQRLVKKICVTCKSTRPVDNATLKNTGISPGEMALSYFGKGCKNCSGTGYRGRIVLAEALVLTPRIKELIMKQESESRIKTAAREEGFKSLRDDGIAKIKAGIVSIEDVLQATAEDHS
ncbi:MAG: Flp pilus assembly complex ATPase component TadA, partial [Candidatus Omnitrophica bacterium]|nr:Flp pilus assembly complex ATPase component TadA [Candidatus Omnitrophota bacterium]